MTRYDLRTRDYLGVPTRKRHLNERLFTVVAPRYDCITRLLSFNRDACWKRRLVAALPDLPAPMCLDMACGTGDIAFQLAEKYPRGQVLGIDLTEAMLDVARARCHLPNVRFVRGDMGNTGLPSGSVDLITGGYALRNAGEVTEALREVHRLLRPGGIAAFLDFSRPANPLLSRTEAFLLTAWGGFWGVILHRNPAVYTYIADSLMASPDRRQLTRLFEAQGFRQRRLQYFFGGIVELRVVEVPAPGNTQ